MNNIKVAKASIGYTVGNVIIKGISFLTLPIFSRLLSTSEYGIYSLFCTYATLLSIILGFGMCSSIRNAQHDFPNSINTYISTLILMVLTIEIICLPLLFVLRKILFKSDEFDNRLIILLLINSLGIAILQIINIHLSLSYNYKLYLIIAFFNTVVNISISLLLIIYYPSDKAFGRIFGSTLPLFIITIFYIVYILINSKPLLDVKMIKYAMVFGFPVIWHYLAQEIVSQSDRLMIDSFCGHSYTGIYGFVYSIASVYSIMYYSTDTVWSVWSMQKFKEKSFEKIRRISKLYSEGTCLIGILMMVVSREIIFIAGGNKYLGGARIFLPCIIGLFFLFLYTIPVSIEYYLKKTKYIAYTTIISAIINVGLNVLLIPRFGYEVAAYTTMISYIIMFLMHWIVAKVIARKELSAHIFYFSDYFGPIIAVVVTAVILFFINDFWVIKYILFTVLGILYFLIFREKSLKMLHFILNYLKGEKYDKKDC